MLTQIENQNEHKLADQLLLFADQLFFLPINYYLALPSRSPQPRPVGWIPCIFSFFHFFSGVDPLHFIVWKGSWFWLFTHFGAIKSPRWIPCIFSSKHLQEVSSRAHKTSLVSPMHCRLSNVILRDYTSWKWTIITRSFANETDQFFFKWWKTAKKSDTFLAILCKKSHELETLHENNFKSCLNPKRKKGKSKSKFILELKIL